MFKRPLIIFLLALSQVAVVAQEENSKVAMADTMRDNGKIYVVVAVILTIFAGIIFYLIRIEKKIKQLEKNQTNH